jgi:hypothetical protein
MIHARSDYDPIQDPRGLIPEDEPVILIRGQDVGALAAIDAYYDYLVNEELGIEGEFLAAIARHRNRIQRWQEIEKVKRPDAPKEALR